MRVAVVPMGGSIEDLDRRDDEAEEIDPDAALAESAEAEESEPGEADGEPEADESESGSAEGEDGVEATG